MPIIKKLMEDFASTALDRNIDLGLDIKSEVAVVHGNPTLLRELMANVIDNALRYTPQGGTVTVALGATAAMIKFVVQDTGLGIAASEREKVFERFYRVDGSTADGSGLGLAIVKEILATHGGAISLRGPTSGSGLIVEIDLPQI